MSGSTLWNVCTSEVNCNQKQLLVSADGLSRMMNSILENAGDDAALKKHGCTVHHVYPCLSLRSFFCTVSEDPLSALYMIKC